MRQRSSRPLGCRLNGGGRRKPPFVSSRRNPEEGVCSRDASDGRDEAISAEADHEASGVGDFACERGECRTTLD